MNINSGTKLMVTARSELANGRVIQQELHPEGLDEDMNDLDILGGAAAYLSTEQGGLLIPAGKDCATFYPLASLHKIDLRLNRVTLATTVGIA